MNSLLKEGRLPADINEKFPLPDGYVWKDDRVLGAWPGISHAENNQPEQGLWIGWVRPKKTTDVNIYAHVYLKSEIFEVVWSPDYSAYPNKVTETLLEALDFLYHTFLLENMK
jgi:hypothetical protein